MPPRSLAVVVALLTQGCIVGLGAGEKEPVQESPDAGVDAEVPVVDPCESLCTGVAKDHELSVTNGEYGSAEAQKWATCFSCRCKSALTVLPTPEELKCSSASGPLARWRPTRDAAGAITGITQLDPNGTDTTECMNPGMAAAGCDLQARFKRMLYDNGQVEFQQLCRKRDVGATGYYEYLIIGHNQKNGATCFWQARDNTFDGENVPTLDLVSAPPAERKKYAETFYLYSAGPSNCINCHATDAFLTSPYLTSQWSIQQANTDPSTRSRILPGKPYALVTADQARPTPVVHDLVTGVGKPLQAQCGGCHKVAKGSYCNFAGKSVAEERLGVLTATDANVLRQQASPLMFWMPPGGTASHAQTLQLQQQVRDACNAP
jgi:hypothetical protein